jgi:hypothetical protein
MAQAPDVQGHSLYVRDQTLTYGTPFLQSECTSGSLCGAQFEQNGCYASPDYSTCQYDSSQGASYCTTCICYGGSAGCDSSSAGSPAGSPAPGWTVFLGTGLISGGTTPALFNGSGTRRSISMKSFILLLSFSLVWNGLCAYV